MGVEVWHAGYRKTIEVSKIGGGRGCLSSPPFLSLQGEIDIGGPHSLLAMYVSAERQTPRPCLILRKKPLKKSKRSNFSNYGKKLVAVIHHRVKTHKKLPCSRQRMKTHKELRFVHWKTKSIICDMKETQFPK